MARMKCTETLYYTLILHLSIALAIQARPLLQNHHEKPSSNIFDTSKYGLLQLNNGLARTPPMGWNSWNFFACNITEIVITETADALVTTGLADLGYVYVNIDDCWSAQERNSEVNLNPTTFKSYYYIYAMFSI
ncbi:hypothetical protein CsSME_00001161 [Camellia sinensis var. sinensis]